MTYSFRAATADEAWLIAAEHFRSGVARAQDSRDGPTRELLHAVFEVDEPTQKWVHSRQPALNPAFAIAEVLWILGGRNDSAFLNAWNPRLPQFAGKGPIYHGAYGHRLRRAYGVDQLTRAARVLTRDPDSRQVVLQLWGAALDIPLPSGKPADPDIPCNVVSLLKVREGRLEWTQIIRSNDMILGVPHNFVQFMSLQEILAGWIGISVGSYVQLSDSLHVYKRDDLSLAAISRVDGARNSDSLLLPYKESQRTLKAALAAADRLLSGALTRLQFKRVVNTPLVPPYRNLVSVLAADLARRRGWTDETKQAIEGCSNQAFVQLWERWVRRVGRT